MVQACSEKIFGLRIGHDPAGLRMELSGELVDVAGLRSLSRLQRELATAGIPVRLTGAPAPLQRLARPARSLLDHTPADAGDQAPCPA